MNAMITSKIVEITGNDATKAFIGKSVSKRNTASGIVYAIGDTGYVLSAAEYRMFAAAGAIASAVAGENTKKTNKVREVAAVPKNKAKKMVAKAPAKVKKKVSRAASVKETASTRPNTASNVAEIARDEEPVKQTYSFGDADTTGYLETSPFLLEYPEPEFNLDAPKHTGIIDFGADIGSRVSKFFDNLGAKGRDKVIASIENEKERTSGEE